MEWLMMLAIGLLTGVISGMLGIGGGTVFTPLLFIYFEQKGTESPHLYALASSLFCTWITALGGVLRHAKLQAEIFKPAIILALGGALGSFLGSFIATSSFYSTQVFKIFFLTLLIITIIRFLQKKEDGTSETTERNSPPMLASIGFIGGMVAALAGVGGGIVMVPALMLILKFPAIRATGFSLISIVFISGTAWLRYAFLTDPELNWMQARLGYVDFTLALPLALGAFVGAWWGVQFASKVKSGIIRWLFIAFASFIALKMSGLF